MNPQAHQSCPQYPPVYLADWDYTIGDSERWCAKTALDWHYAAGGLYPMDYNNRLSAIMGATMWSHLVAVFADLPAPGPAYDSHQLLKACQTTQRTRCEGLSTVGLLSIPFYCIFALFSISSGIAGMMVFVLLVIVLSLIFSASVQEKSQSAYRDFSGQLNPHQRALLDNAQKEYAQYCYWQQQQDYYWQQQQQQQIQNMFNNINR